MFSRHETVIHMTGTLAPLQRDNEIDLGELLGSLRNHRWCIMRITSLFIGLCIIYDITATPVYHATSTAQVEQKVPDLPGLSALSQTLGASAPEASTQSALIT